MDSSSMTKSKVLEFTHGLMAVNTKAGGTEANSMELEHTTIVRKALSNMASGRMERELNGSMSSQ